MTTALDQKVDAIHSSVKAMIEEIRRDGKLSDEEMDVMQDIENAFTDLLADFGFEVGDKRID